MRVDFLPAKSGRIVLRRLATSDLPAFLDYRRDPEIARYQGWEPMTDDEARAFLADVAGGDLLEPGHWSQIAVTRADTGALIGDIGIFVSEDGTEAEIGVTLRRDAHGQGLASEAVGESIRIVFEHTAAERVIGITDIRNRPSILLLQRVGMRRVGQQDSVVKGEACSEFVYALTRADAGMQASSA